MEMDRRSILARSVFHAFIAGQAFGKRPSATLAGAQIVPKLTLFWTMALPTLFEILLRPKQGRWYVDDTHAIDSRPALNGMHRVVTMHASDRYPKSGTLEELRVRRTQRGTLRALRMGLSEKA